MSDKLSVDAFCSALLKNLDTLVSNLADEVKTKDEMSIALAGGLVRMFGTEIHALSHHHLKVVKVLKMQEDKIKELESQIKTLKKECLD